MMPLIDVLGVSVATSKCSHCTREAYKLCHRCVTNYVCHVHDGVDIQHSVVLPLCLPCRWGQQR